MESDKIKSIDDFFESLVGLPYDKNTTIFRGQSNFKWSIKPKLLRQEINISYQLIEKILFSPYINDKNIPFLQNKDPLEYISILQHYHIPTRMLDFTKDPLIALFFACYEEISSNTDGVLMLTDKRNFSDLSLNNYKNEFNTKYFKDISKDQLEMRLSNPEISYFEPLFSNPRFRCQNGCFIFFPFEPINIEDTEYIDLERYIRYVNKHNENLKSDNRVYLLKKNIDKDYKNKILFELELKYSISYENLMLPCMFSNSLENEFQSLLKEITDNIDVIHNIYSLTKPIT